MAEVIGGTYEIIKQLGAGGGGVVYLARHLRLDKQVVLKADRRKIMTNPELLRREVDVLKNLKHPYIPQVYDFFSDGETVYTAMDYVDGESLDRFLKRGEWFSQPQVIAWAKQLLQALDYLHSPIHGSPPKGYVHSDIKPANLMLRPNGDICLIDFNISLALGEENVIGASAGYASPEHYGLDFSLYSRTVTQNEEGALTMDDGTATLPMPQGGSTKKIRPDVRSDIYSTGATLYHLLSGLRPAKNAIEVSPLTEKEVSPQISRIIGKAMNPNANLRYQTAAEMLWDLEHLHENDRRTQRLRKTAVTVAAVLSLAFLAGGIMTFTGLRQMERIQARERQAAETDREALSLVTQSEDARRQGDIPMAVSAAMRALSMDGAPYAAQAQLNLTEALGVYDLSDGFRNSLVIQLPSTPIKAVLSPEGTRAAVLTLGQVQVFDTESGAELAALPAEKSALSDLVFSGEDILFCPGEEGVLAYDLAGGSTLWTGEKATGLTLSGDGRTLAAVYKDSESAKVYDAGTGELLQTVEFGRRHQDGAANDIYADPEKDVFALSGDGRYLAVSFADGALTVYDLQNRENDLSIYEATEYTRFEGGFFENYFAFSSSNESESVFAVVDVAHLAQTVGFSAPNVFHVRTDENGVCLSLEDTLVRIDPEAGEQTELAYTDGDIAAYDLSGDYTLVLQEDGALAFFDKDAREVETLEPGWCDFACISGGYVLSASRDASFVRILRLESHSEAQLLHYDGDYLHAEARVGRDGTVMLFRYDGFRLYAPDGTLLTEAPIPDASQVYDQQYRRDEGVLEVIYYDGTVRHYSAADGTLVSETQEELPDKSLQEEFLAGNFRISAPLHERTTVYNRETGAVVRELETEDSLAYVTEAGDFLIVEYITAQGERYGLLLDEACETLARLPGLCDILEDGTLVFDDMRGNLRQSRIYSTQELLTLGESYQGGIAT